MERLTTNKSVSDMSMVELAHNSCYVDSEGNARYRDYEMEMDARDFARNLMVTLTKDELPVDDTEFDEEILDNLTIDPFSDVRGLIAVFYRNMWAMADLREKLKRDEDAEEQGLLLRLPCKVGDTVWVVTSPFNVFDDIEYDENMKDEVYEAFISMNAGSNIEFMQKQQITLSERILENAILGKPYSLQKRKPKPS